MERKWIKGVPPKLMHDKLGIYQGNWMPQMDRYWESNDGYSVMSRLLDTLWGKVEHITISRLRPSCDGSGDIGWAIKQQIKNELFGENRAAIEVFPKENLLVDVMDVYHLWVFEKHFELPFGIHPTEHKKSRYINRGYNFTHIDMKDYEEFKKEQGVTYEGN